MLFENEPFFKLIQLVAGIYVNTRKYSESKIRDLNMTYPQLGALMALIRNDDITQSELARLLETDNTTSMVLCDSLEKRGWLTRKSDKSDRRVNRLQLTAEGKKVYGLAMSSIQDGYTRCFEHIDVNEINTLLPILEQIYLNVKEAVRSS